MLADTGPPKPLIYLTRGFHEERTSTVAMAGRSWTMNWRLEEACSLTIVAGEDPMAIIKVCLIAESLDRFCIGLCLLREGLIKSLDLVERDGARVIRLQRSARGTLIHIGNGKIVLSLDETELERWMHFSLRTVRDGAAEVDHFDMEAVLEGRGTQATTVVVAFPSSAPSVSPDEARRRLGL